MLGVRLLPRDPLTTTQRSQLVLLGVLLTSLFEIPPAPAAPQFHAAYRPAVCGAGQTHLWQETRFCNGLFADLIFGRERNADLGFGLHGELSTAGFWDARFGGGPSLLVPVLPDYPLVISLSAQTHELRALSLGTSLFFGSRSYNFHGAYNLALGLFVAGYRDLDEQPESLLAAGLELDTFFLVAPFMLALAELR